MPPASPPPPPPVAREITWGGPYQLATGAAMAAAREALGGRYGPATESRDWSVPPETTLATVRTYYADALKGWTEIRGLPHVLGDGEVAGWEAPGRALVVSLLPRPAAEGEPRKVLVVTRFER